MIKDCTWCQDIVDLTTLTLFRYISGLFGYLLLLHLPHRQCSNFGHIGDSQWCLAKGIGRNKIDVAVIVNRVCIKEVVWCRVVLDKGP
jgi:hypothetical protein